MSLKTAEELGIPMPYPTIKPLFVALFMTLMFGSLLFIHENMLKVADHGRHPLRRDDDGVPLRLAHVSARTPSRVTRRVSVSN